MREQDRVAEVDPHAASALQASGAVLLDVREADEWEAGHAPGAVHVPLGSLRLGDVPPGSRVVTVCRSGARSAKAAAALQAAGIDVQNLSGGMRAWADEGLPVERDDGSVGLVA